MFQTERVLKLKKIQERVQEYLFHRCLYLSRKYLTKRTKLSE